MLATLVPKVTKVPQDPSKSTKTGKVLSTGLKILILLLLLLGIFFRFYNLDHKVYWHDEAYTSLRTFGHTSQEFKQLADGRVINREDLQKFQQINPDKNIINTLESLSSEDPQHPPLYYILLRGWAQIFGDSVGGIRSLSAVISLLVFPCAFWLCWELFGTALVGWVAIALIAVSPFQLAYAQEAREYVLWAVTTLLSSAALLRAMRLKTKPAWGIYAASLALGFYTFLFTGLVAIGHGIYVFAIERFRFSKTVISYLLASIAGFLAFSPWILVLITNFNRFQASTSWTWKFRVPVLTLIKTWVLHLSYIWIDFDLTLEIFLFKYLIQPIVITLVGGSIYLVCRRTPIRVWLFILTLIGSTAIPLMVPDIISGGVRSISNRYLIPYFLGIQLAVAYILATGISSSSFSKRKIWQAIATAIIAIGIVSCVVSSQADIWWNKFFSQSLPKMARILNQTKSPLLISGVPPYENVGHLLSLSYLVNNTVQFQVISQPNLLKMPTEEASDVFLFNPSESLRLETEKHHQSKAKRILRDQYMTLWKLGKK